MRAVPFPAERFGELLRTSPDLADARPPSPKGNVVNLSVQQSSVGGDAYIAPQEMPRFCTRLWQIRLRARADVGIGPYGSALS